MAHLRAALILTVWALLVGLGLPGFDALDDHALRSPADQAAWRAGVAEPWASLGLGITRLNRAWRLPVVAALAPLQRPLRVGQDWYLYRDGPSVLRRLEIHVDGTLRHRSADPAYPWLADVLRNRRIRPVVESTCASEHGANWRGLGRLVISRALQDWPDTRTLTLTCTEAPFPTPDAVIVEAKVHHRYRATAPGWEVVPG